METAQSLQSRREGRSTRRINISKLIAILAVALIAGILLAVLIEVVIVLTQPEPVRTEIPPVEQVIMDGAPQCVAPKTQVNGAQYLKVTTPAGLHFRTKIDDKLSEATIKVTLMKDFVLKVRGGNRVCSNDMTWIPVAMSFGGKTVNGWVAESAFRANKSYVETFVESK